MPTLTVAIDWGFWGVVVALVGIVVALAATVIVYVFGRRDATQTTVSVDAQMDESGLVHVLVKKSGQPVVHVRDVKVLRAGTNEVIRVRSRHPSGDFDIEGTTAKDCFFTVDPTAYAWNIDIEVWTDATTKSVAAAAKLNRGDFIKLPDGVKLTAVQ